MDLLLDWLGVSARVLGWSSRLITWNLFLGIIPLILSVWLFRFSKKRSPLWWLLFAIFVAFLPNAPYILTDIIHYVKYIQRGIPESVAIFALTPQYILYLVAGWQCYVMSLLNLNYYLENQGKKHFIFATELATHLLAAIGIYLGRFLRFNSWDFVTQPDDVVEGLAVSLSHKQPLLAITITFFILTFLYWISKQINLGLVLRYQQRQRSS